MLVYGVIYNYTYILFMIKTISLFLITNFAVLLVLSFSLQIFNVANMGFFLILALVIGMGGSFISLAMSKSMAKRSTGAQVIDSPSNNSERRLVEIIDSLAIGAGISKPEIAIYDSPDINAFATGMNRDNALVAVSSGLLDNMTEEEVEAVLAHEISHVANGDMIRLSLIQGVLNTFVMVFARIVGQIIDRVVFKNQRGAGIGYYLSIMIAEVVLGVLANIIVMWFSRKREFYADAGAARLVGKNKMIAALERLKMAHSEALPAQLTAFGINSSKAMGLFMSHPPLEVRIDALVQERYLRVTLLKR
jgi:heat shock protein HtpX